MTGEGALFDAGRLLSDKITDWLNKVIDEDEAHYIDPLHSWNRLDFNLVGLLGMVDRMDPPLTSGMLQRVSDVRAQWAEMDRAYRSLIDDDLAAFNRLSEKHSIPAIDPVPR